MTKSTTAKAPDTGNPARRRQYLRGDQVVAAAARLAADGHDFESALVKLHMSRRALQCALRRAGRLEVLEALQDRTRWRPDQALALANRMLSLLPPEDLRQVETRCQEMLGDVHPEDPQIQPAGRQVRGPGGVVRWVAA